MSFGQRTTGTFGTGQPASSDGTPEYKAGGVTVDWATVPANASDTTLQDGTIAPAGVKYIPRGTVLTRITTGSKYGPHDAGASDGRQTPVRGGTYILNYNVLQTDLHFENPPGVFEGGGVYQDRLNILAAGVYTNTGAWSTAVAAALPNIKPVKNP